MKRKLAACALALAMLVGPASAAAFADVDPEQYYAQAVNWAVGKGITTGTTPSTFSPDSPCTRGQILTFLWRAAGSPEPQSTESPFDDVTPDMNQDFYRAILWAHEKGIIDPSDLEEGRLLPNAPCTRAATMSFLWRYAGSPVPHAAVFFDDVPPEAHYAQAVGWATENGITSGAAENAFHPDAACTRGQIVAFLYRSIGTAALEVSVEPEPEEPGTSSQGVQPLRTITGGGDAYSLGLDGSEFTSENVYEAKVQVAVYSDVEAVMTVTVPFPLFQAWDYTVRFTSEKAVYSFTYSRWDEAFADMVSWQGEHKLSRMTTEIPGAAPEMVPLELEVSDDDRMGGTVSWQVILPPGCALRFDQLEGYAVSCEVNSGA